MSGSFAKFSVSKAVSGIGGGLVAKNDRFEVYADRRRVGRAGDRSYSTTFSVVRVLSTEPRKIEAVVMPDTCRSNLNKVIAHLEKMS